MRPGDEIITVAAGFPTTVNPILQIGAVPVFIDVELGTYVPTLEAIAAAIGPRTRGVMIAHTMGIPFDAAGVSEMCRQHGLWLIEDCCDALGTKLRGRQVGTFGDFGDAFVLSGPPHHVGEGGAVVTDDRATCTHRRARSAIGAATAIAPAARTTPAAVGSTQQFGTLPFGYDHKYVYSHIGYNLKATDLQAAIGCAQLKKLDRIHRRAAAELGEACARRCAPYADRLILPETPAESEPSYFGFVITVRDDAGFTRNEITAFLEAGEDRDPQSVLRQS